MIVKPSPLEIYLLWLDAALHKVAAEAKASRSTSKTQKSKKRRESGQFDDAFVASTERLVAGKQFVD